MADILRGRGQRRKWRLREWEMLDYCRYCHRMMDLVDATVDHIVPLARGGPDDETNWKLCCSECNNSKGSISLDEWMAKMAQAKKAAPPAPRPKTKPQDGPILSREYTLRLGSIRATKKSWARKKPRK